MSEAKIQNILSRLRTNMEAHTDSRKQEHAAAIQAITIELEKDVSHLFTELDSDISTTESELEEINKEIGNFLKKLKGEIKQIAENASGFFEFMVHNGSLFHDPVVREELDPTEMLELQQQFLEENADIAAQAKKFKKSIQGVEEEVTEFVKKLHKKVSHLEETIYAIDEGTKEAIITKLSTFINNLKKLNSKPFINEVIDEYLAARKAEEEAKTA